MKEERMMILAMLEQGKITSEEAIKLMDALEDETIFKEKERNKKDSQKEDRKEYDFKSTFDTLEDIGSDIGSALSSMFDGLKDFNPSFGFKNSYESLTEDLDMDLSDMESINLDFRGVNDSITIRPTDGNKLLIKVICQYKTGLLEENEPYFDFTKEDNTIIFNPKYNSNISIQLNISLPDKYYNEISLKSSNGKIDIENLNANSLYCETSNSAIEILKANIMKIDLTTKNGKIKLKDIKSNYIKTHTTNSSVFLMDTLATDIDVKTSNGKIDLKNLSGKNLVSKTSNAPINVKDLSLNKIQLISSNGKITSSDLDFDKSEEIQLVTSNASIASDLESINKDVIFDLETSMGNIDLGLENLIYKTNKQVNLGLKKIVAHSLNYDENKDHLKFTASTSNASIKINSL